MFFDNTTNSETRMAIARAHVERGKILGEVWVGLTGLIRLRKGGKAGLQ